jgi:hypothetical protein
MKNFPKINLVQDALHGMAYYIFLKSLRRLEEFRKNPHVKIPPKSPSTNFQSLGKFKNPISIRKEFFLRIQPTRTSRPAHSPGLGLPASPSRPTPPGPNRPAHLASQTLGPRVPLAYFTEDVFLFGSRLLEPVAFSLCHRHAGPACQFRHLPRAGRPRSEFSPRRHCPAPRMPLSLYNPPSSLPLLIPFKPSVNGP